MIIYSFFFLSQMGKYVENHTTFMSQDFHQVHFISKLPADKFLLFFSTAEFWYIYIYIYRTCGHDAVILIFLVKVFFLTVEFRYESCQTCRHTTIILSFRFFIKDNYWIWITGGNLVWHKWFCGWFSLQIYSAYAMIIIISKFSEWVI